MKEFILQSHHYLAFLALILLVIATVNGIIGYFGKKDFTDFAKKVNLYALITMHIMLLLGIALLFVDLSDVDYDTLMSNPDTRKMFVEHPMVNIIAAILVTVGNAKVKRKLLSLDKYKLTMLYYGAALILILSRVSFDRLLA